MIITLIRSGGFTGIPLKKIVDTTQIDSKNAEQIEDLIHRTDFENLQKSSQTPHRDSFVYTITIQNDTVLGPLQVSEESLDDDGKALMEMLRSV